MLRFTLSLGLGALLAVGCSDDDPAITIGDADALSAEGCDALSASATPLTAAATPEGASEAIIEPGVAYEITVDGTGYATLRSDVDHHDWALFVSEETEVTSTGLAFPTAQVAGACEDAGLWDYRVHVHAAEDFLLELRAEGTVWVYATKADAGEGGDGGHMHDHDAGHTHEHDGGHTHEHDAGTHDHDAGTHDHDAGHMHDHDAGAHDHDAGV